MSDFEVSVTDEKFLNLSDKLKIEIIRYLDLLKVPMGSYTKQEQI